MENQQGVYINVLNVGNVPINIVEVGLLHGKKQCINTNTIAKAQGILKQMESVEQSFPSQGLKETFKEKKEGYMLLQRMQRDMYIKSIYAMQ